MSPTFFRRLAAFVFLFALLLPQAVTAQAIHKCRAGDGSATYQDRPCAPGTQQAWTRPMPAAEPTALAPARPPARQVAARNASTPARSGTRKRRPAPSGAVISQYRDPQGCEKAKAQRAQAYARLGLRRDFDTSRRLDDRVETAYR